MIHKHLSEFKPIDIQLNQTIDSSIYSGINSILTKISKSQQKSSQSMELIKDEIEGLVSNHSSIIEDLRQREAHLKKDLETVQVGLLDYIDILYELHNAAKMLNDANFLDTIGVALKGANQINSRLGIYEIAEIDMLLDASIHFVSGNVITKDKFLDGKIAKIIKQGFRREKEILRKATVEIYYFEV